jgi:hypothetical protein
MSRQQRFRVNPGVIQQERPEARTGVFRTRQGMILDDYELTTKRASLWTGAGREIISLGYTPGPVAAADRTGVAQPVGYVTIPQIFTRARGPLAASAHKVGAAQVRVLIGCVFVEIGIESEIWHICRAVILTI